MTNSHDTSPRHDYADKIAKMLKMAESFAAQGNEDTAASYTAKASQLQLEMMIADSDVRAAAGEADGPTDELGNQVVQGLPKGAGYIKAKRDLVYGLASIFHLKTTISHDRAFVTLYGHETDRAFVQQLFDSLALQMHSHMEHDAAHTNSWPTRIDRSWRTSYAHGWVTRVLERLRASRRAQETEAVSQGPGTALVLRDRSVAVADYFDSYFAGRKLGSSYKNRSVRDAAGYGSGREAANRAALGGKAVGGQRGAIGR